ncbi:Hypothetical protein NCS54_01197700 [Fusarium falciforme]|uniref:Hypothetical protein n=1 Tax=Fusarium falciforme TaxID=195108 RepID=UPI0023008579|nr:Hypothetical protein NCS54_01197700 [Fusarium falciforme]WAO94395.1 Hypothetical protein NCS54_01197700 [Fusarium falciforme]
MSTASVESMAAAPAGSASGSGLLGDSCFDAKKHIAYSPPSKVLTMEDLHLKSTPISSVASTEPFPLLSRDAVLQHRRELFSTEVLGNCLYHTRPGSVQLRGMAPRYAPFIHKFWNSPEVLKILSDIAGVELVPVYDYEISHTNVQLGPNGVPGIYSTPVEPPEASEEAIAEFENARSRPKVVTDQTKPIIEWHEDAYPFVCVVMLSDARHMVGGETELMGGDGTTLKVKSPQMGCAVLLQGRHITHTAAPAGNMPERITIVTSFRPKNPVLLDESTNGDIRNKSLLPELYYQWTTYRLHVLSERARIAAELLKEKYEKTIGNEKPGHCSSEVVNLQKVTEWANEQMAYIEHTLYAMRPLDENGR